MRFRRFVAVAWTLIRLYASYRLAPAGRRDDPALHRRNAERIIAVVLERKGLLIKVCQWMATRADLLPEEYVEVLSQLHDAVPPRPWPEIHPHLEASFGRPVEEVFRSFAREPIAAASLAQVHEATLWDGRRVAVKVQYPDIAAIVATDVRNLRFFLRLIHAVERNVDFVPLLDEVERYVTEELDFVHEGKNAEAVAHVFAGRSDVVVPKIVWELTSRKVLVMEFVDGIKVTEIDELTRAGIDRREVAEQLVRVYAEQLLIHGVFHADPHPGNIFVQRPAETGGPPPIVLLDFGVVKELPARFRQDLAGTLLSMLRGRPAEMLEHLGRLGFRTRKGTYEDLVPVTQAILRFAGERPGEIVADAEILERFGTEILRAYRTNPVVRIPEDILLVMRVMGILGGVERQLSTRIDLIGLLLPFAREGVARAEHAPGGGA